MAKRNPAIIKRDSKENWRKSKYIPEENVIILVDNDDGSVELMIGDGETEVNQLENILKDTKISFNAMVNEEDTLIL